MPQKKPSAQSRISSLPPFDEESGDLNVVIETPQGSRNKFKFDEEQDLFKLSGVLPTGAAFPFDFGFIPSTLGGDGDALDVLLLMDSPTFVGCLVTCRLIGVIEAEQTEDGEVMRNDRLIAVATHSRTHEDVKSIDDLSRNLIDEIEHFFVSYNQIKGKSFRVQGRFGPERALKVVKEGRTQRRPARSRKAGK